MSTQEQKPTFNNFTSQKPFTVNEALRKAYTKHHYPLDCKLCGKELQTGDKARWIYANGTPGMATGNFFVCGACDDVTEIILAKAKEQYALAVTLAKRWGIYGPDWETR